MKYLHTLPPFNKQASQTYDSQVEERHKEKNNEKRTKEISNLVELNEATVAVSEILHLDYHQKKSHIR